MREYLLKRLFLGAFTLWGTVTAVFFMARALPGDPVDMLLGEGASQSSRAELRRSLHLEGPLPVQYASFMGDLVRLDLGDSLRTRRGVAEEIGEAFPLTAGLGSVALALACLIALPAGALAALLPGRLADRATRALSTACLALPSFVLGPLLLLNFAVIRPWFPISGSDEPGAVWLPALTLALPLSAVLGRMTRASLLEESSRDYIRTARAKGLSRAAAFWKHASRNALPPVITTAALQFAALLTGAIIVEKIFRWPGLGTLLISSIGSRDYPVIQGIVLLFSFVYICVNLLTDLTYAWADPRLRTAGVVS